jgi:peptide/nickel transport system substrate-binding protein
MSRGMRSDLRSSFALFAAIAFLSAFVFGRGSALAAGAGPTEPPILAEAVKAGTLPAMADRLPRSPRVLDIKGMGREPGIPGGEIRLLMADQRDLRMLTIYGYTRLVVFNDKQELVPDILERVDISAGRTAHHLPLTISAIGGRMSRITSV